MKRTLRGFGLAILGVLALEVMAAPTAEAESPAKLTAEENPVTLDGEQEGLITFTRGGRAIHCSIANFHAVSNSGDTTIAMEPEYKGCTSSVGPATITMNECSYLLHLTADEVIGGHTYTATTDVVCPLGSAIELHLYTSHTNHTNNSSTCTYHITDENVSGPTNQGLKTIDLTNEPPSAETPKDWIRAHINITGMHTTRTVGGALLCGAEVDTASSVHGTMILKGLDEVSDPNGITISTH